MSVEMVSAQADDLTPFSAGGHIDVFLRDGLVRQYSLMNDPRTIIVINLLSFWKIRAVVARPLFINHFALVM